MHELGERRPYVPTAGRTNAKAQIHVVEGDGNPLIQAAYIFETAPANHYAGARYGSGLMLEGISAQVARVATGQPTVSMTRETARANDHPTVLTCGGQVPEAHPDGPNFRLNGKGHPLLEPSRCERRVRHSCAASGRHTERQDESRVSAGLPSEGSGGWRAAKTGHGRCVVASGSTSARTGQMVASRTLESGSNTDSRTGIEG